MHIRAECCLIPWEQTKSKVAENMIKRQCYKTLASLHYRNSQKNDHQLPEAFIYTFVHSQCQNFYVLGLHLYVCMYVLVQVPYNVLYMTVRISGLFWGCKFR